ncbi:MAG: FHA domain-containing protein [Gemmatimonadota bacterium]|nr:FHA domain-containing protein [Gemmatimonadota bacterium]
MPYIEHDDELRELTPPDTVVGSGAQATWRIASKDLAGRHFTVRLTGGGAMVIPASPQSIVGVSGRQAPASGTELQDGDAITAGATRFVYLSNRDSPRPPRPPAQPEAYLVDSRSRQAYLLRGRALTIGRDAASGLMLRDATVSRHHADVRAEAGGFVLYSSGATGTLLNGTQLGAPRLLAEGDQIQIGEARLAFAENLPPGLRVVEPAVPSDDVLTQRATMLEQAVVTPGEVRRYSDRRPIPLWTVVLAMLVIIIALALIF